MLPHESLDSEWEGGGVEQDLPAARERRVRIEEFQELKVFMNRIIFTSMKTATNFKLKNSVMPFKIPPKYLNFQ